MNKSEMAVWMPVDEIKKLKDKIMIILDGDASVQAQDHIEGLLDELIEQAEMLVYEDDGEE